MKIKIVKNKYINSLLLLMLFSAMAHMLALFYITIKTGNLYVINYFNIIQITYFFPDAFGGWLGNMFSVVFVAVLYLIILSVNKTE